MRESVFVIHARSQDRGVGQSVRRSKHRGVGEGALGPGNLCVLTAALVCAGQVICVPPATALVCARLVLTA